MIHNPLLVVVPHAIFEQSETAAICYVMRQVESVTRDFYIFGGKWNQVFGHPTTLQDFIEIELEITTPVRYNSITVKDFIANFDQLKKCLGYNASLLTVNLEVKQINTEHLNGFIDDDGDYLVVIDLCKN